MDRVEAFPMIDAQGLAALALLHLPVHIYSFSRAGICWANQAALEIWQAESVEALQLRQSEPHSMAVERRLAEYQEAFARAERRTEVWTLYPRGVPMAMYSNCRGVSLAGHPKAMLVESSPVEPVILPAADLRALEAVRHAELMVSLFSQDGEVLMRNPSAAACFPEQSAEDEGRKDQFRSMFANARDADGLLADVETFGHATGSFILALDGHPLHRIQVRRTHDPVSGAPALLVLQEDVSMSQIIHQKLEESEDAFHSILELTKSAVVVVSAHTGAIMYCSTDAAVLLGCSTAGRSSVRDLFVSYSAFLDFRASVMSLGSAGLDTIVHLSNGVLALAAVAGSKVRFQGQDAIMMTVTLKDQLISQTVELQQALVDEARNSDILRNRFACTAHELRTPLAIIDSTAQRMERAVRPLPAADLRGRAQKIRKNVQRLLQLIDTNTLNRPAQGAALRYSPELLDLAPALHGVIEVMQEGCPALEVDCEVGSLPSIWIDKSLIEHLFENLLGNSIKYHDGVPRVEIRSYVSASEIEITLRDWGIGIPPGDRAGIFAANSRGSNVGARPGSGLGLYIVAQIMAVHGGRIELAELNGPGTQFSLHFPRDFSMEGSGI